MPSHCRGLGLDQGERENISSPSSPEARVCGSESRESCGTSMDRKDIDGSERPIGQSTAAGGSEPSDIAARTGLSERLRDALSGEGDGDLLLEGTGGEIGILQWLRALDLQVVGACRADDRLKPLLKLNVSGSTTEDRLLAQLSQHFEVVEVGMLARCLFAPLVSIRSGKITKQGSLLCPTSIRGHLNLSLLPSSNMCISFTNDDGSTERLAIVAKASESPEVTIEEISADSSGRSFLLKLPGSRILYFWCSEKSKIHGLEMIAKMKDLLCAKPTLSYLTGISESRLESFATHLRAYILGSSRTLESASSLLVPSNVHASISDFHASSKTTRICFGPAAHTTKVQTLLQGSLSPRSSTFKDGAQKGSLSNRCTAREKHRRRGDCSSSLPTTSCTTHALPTKYEDAKSISSTPGHTEHFFPSCCLPEIRCISSPLSPASSLVDPYPSQANMSNPPISPYYCWCPPYTPLQYTISSHLPTISPESLPLPSLSALLSLEGPPLPINPSSLPIGVSELPGLNLPSLFPETLVCLSFPVSTCVSLPASQQIPIFTPFMSDPIVHIPVLDVCSAGQGYLVSAEPTISASIAPLMPSSLSPLIPQTESVAEKSARETLRALMASSPISNVPHLVSMLPDVISAADRNLSCAYAAKPTSVFAGSRGLYSGTLDVKAAADGASFMNFASSSRIAYGSIAVREKHANFEEDLPECHVSEGSSCVDGDDTLDL